MRRNLGNSGQTNYGQQIRESIFLSSVSFIHSRSLPAAAFAFKIADFRTPRLSGDLPTDPDLRCPSQLRLTGALEPGLGWGSPAPLAGSGTPEHRLPNRCSGTERHRALPTVPGPTPGPIVLLALGQKPRFLVSAGKSGTMGL